MSVFDVFINMILKLLHEFQNMMFSPSKSILLDGAIEEDNPFMVTYSYLFHVIVIYDNPTVLDRWGNSYGRMPRYCACRESYSTQKYFTKKQILKIPFARCHRNKISHRGRRQFTLPIPFAKIYKCVIIQLEFKMVSKIITIMNFVHLNIPWFQFIKHAN